MNDQPNNTPSVLTNPYGGRVRSYTWVSKINTLIGTVLIGSTQSLGVRPGFYRTWWERSDLPKEWSFETSKDYLAEAAFREDLCGRVAKLAAIAGALIVALPVGVLLIKNALQ